MIISSMLACARKHTGMEPGLAHIGVPTFGFLSTAPKDTGNIWYRDAATR